MVSGTITVSSRRDLISGVAAVTLYVDTNFTLLKQPPFYSRYLRLAPGSHVLTARATDQVGNQSRNKSHNSGGEAIRVEITSPTMAALSISRVHSYRVDL